MKRWVLLVLFLLLDASDGFMKNTLSKAQRNIFTIKMKDEQKEIPFSREWALARGMEPGFGGLWPGNPDAKKVISFKCL